MDNKKYTEGLENMNRQAQTKNAQVTLYIIIGIMMLAAIGTGVYLTNKFAAIPTADKPAAINNFVETCLQQTSTNALEKLGEHGGYIYPTDSELSGREFNFGADQTESDALYLSPPDENPVIYWWQMRSKNNCKNCTLSTQNKPSFDEQILQLQQYIAKKLPDCFNNFEPFLKQMYHVQTENSSIKIIPTEKDLKIILNMPTTISRGGAQTKVQSFETTIDVPLKKIYELADKIEEDELANQRLEELTMHWITLNSGADPAKLPPPSLLTHTAQIIKWNKQVVERNLRDALTLLMPLIKINNTKTKEARVKNEYEQGAYNALKYTVQNASSDASEVEFNYLDDALYFKITPSQQNTIIPEVKSTNFPLNLAPRFQTNTYEFFYDISAPVLARIKTPSALHGKGYTYNFAMELNIRKNKNMMQYQRGEGAIESWDADQHNFSLTTATKKYEKCESREDKFFCKQNNKQYDKEEDCANECTATTTEKITTTKIANKHFCDPEQRASGTIKIKVTDKKTKNPISNATISYQCGKQLSCTIGTTNQQGIFRQKMPVCYNGLVKINADGHQTNTQTITTQMDKTAELTAELEPVKTIKIGFRKAQIKTGDNGEKSCCDYSAIGPFEKVSLTIERIKENSLDREFVRFANTEQGQQETTIEIIPGTYKVTALLDDELGFAIPPKCAQQSGQFYPEDAQIFKPAVLGGLQLDNDSGYWQITSDGLEQTQKTIFTVLKFTTPTCVDSENCITKPCIGIEETTKAQEYSKDYRNEIEPRAITG